MRVKQPYDEPRIVPWLGDRVVEAGEIVDVPGDMLASFLEAGWTPTDAQAKAAAEKLAQERQAKEEAATKLVGEAGPELLTMPASGHVTPRTSGREGASDGDR